MPGRNHTKWGSVMPKLLLQKQEVVVRDPQYRDDVRELMDFGTIRQIASAAAMEVEDRKSVV